MSAGPLCFASSVRLLVVTPTFGRGGAEEYVVAIVKGAQERGWNVDLALPGNPETESIAADAKRVGAHVVDVSWAGAATGKFSATTDVVSDTLRALWAIRKARPHVIHVSLPSPHRGLGAMIAAALTQTPLVTTFQVASDEPLMSWPWRLAYRFLRRSGQRWIAVSDNNRSQLARTFMWPEHAISRIYNGVRVPPLPSASERHGRQLTARAELGMSPTSKVLLTTARLTEQKGHRYVIPAVSEVRDAYPEVVFVWAGDGVDRPVLEAAARDAEVDDSILFLGHRDDVGRLLDAADLFVFPSLFEGSPFAVMEAMACGVPVVSSNRGPMPELVMDDRTGRTFEVEKPADIAATIIDGLKNPGLSHRMARRAHGLATAQFSLDVMVATTLEVLTEHAVGGLRSKSSPPPADATTTDA